MTKSLGMILGGAALIASLSLLPETALAHSAGISIASPTDGQLFEVETLPTTILFQGVITHSPGNVNDMQACLDVDGATLCGAIISGVGNIGTYPYAIPVEFAAEGQHTVQASTDKSGGGHAGSSTPITITITLTPVACDEVDPPAHANHYLNGLDLPQSFATYRGQVLRIIAQNSEAGRYGSCTYDYGLVGDDVNDLLNQLDY